LTVGRWADPAPADEELEVFAAMTREEIARLVLALLVQELLPVPRISPRSQESAAKNSGSDRTT
jgi:hypothetical protein